jgi:hypothetical protein
VAEACRLLREELGLSGRGVTISTVGVPNTIRRLAALKLPATLAVSLHAPNQELRERLIPSAKAYPLAALMADCKAYFATTKRRVTFEYTLMAGVNDRRAHAEELARLLRAHRVAHHVNVIPVRVLFVLCLFVCLFGRGKGGETTTDQSLKKHTNAPHYKTVEPRRRVRIPAAEHRRRGRVPARAGRRGGPK